MIDYIKPEARLNYILSNVKNYKILEIEKILVDDGIEVDKSFFINVVNSVHPAIWLAAAQQRFSQKEFHVMMNSLFSLNFKKLHYYLFESLDPAVNPDSVNTNDLLNWDEFLETRDFVMNIYAFFNNLDIQDFGKKRLTSLFAPVSNRNVIYDYIYQSLKDPYADHDFLIQLIVSELESSDNTYLIKLLLRSFNNSGLPVPEHWLKHFGI